HKNTITMNDLRPSRGYRKIGTRDQRYNNAVGTFMMKRRIERYFSSSFDEVQQCRLSDLLERMTHVKLNDICKLLKKEKPLLAIRMIDKTLSKVYEAS
ncbi:hypothetical protein, partial [Flammeovirga sp. OC4]|uniref:hypothetical protein n=1 Tax=Flammeovirga sp. OC4 TaxID=1382345 RepID=UPI0005C734D6